MFKDVACVTLPDGKFNRMTYDEAMDKYGSDKPDLRAGGGRPRLIPLRVTEDGDLQGAKAVMEGLTDLHRKTILDMMNAQQGDLIILVAGDPAVVNRSLDRVRGLASVGMEEDEERYETLHHPFTAPHPDDLESGLPLDKCRAVAYDLVYNGVEIGGGSLRIYRTDVQTMLFDAIGIQEEEAQEKFGHLIESLNVGAPPHGGMPLESSAEKSKTAASTSSRNKPRIAKQARNEEISDDKVSSVSTREAGRAREPREEYAALARGNQFPLVGQGRGRPKVVAGASARAQEISPKRIHPHRLFYPGAKYSPEELNPYKAKEVLMRSDLTVQRGTIPQDVVRDQADFRNTDFLKYFLKDSGKLVPRRKTKLPAKLHRELMREIKLSRSSGLDESLGQKYCFKS
eukprot:jgi/Picre1/34640/NNA_002108.t1